MSLFGYIKIGFVALTIGLGLNNVRLSKKVDKLDNALSRATINMHYYEKALSKAENNNTVLQLTVEDFKRSEDSLIQVIKKQAKELKIKEKELKTVASIETQISDTTVQELPITNDCNFCVELKPNQLTTIKVSRVDSVLTHILDIRNRQDLFIDEKEVWRVKGFFRRLFTFNFKKDRISNYQIINTNPLIKTIETRVMNISK